MNSKVARIHSVLSFAYFFAGVGVLVMIRALFRPQHDELGFGVACFFVAGVIGLMHLSASRGASKGAPWGRTMSRVIGVLLLFGFPVGTAIGAFILSQCGSKWQAGSTASLLS